MSTEVEEAGIVPFVLDDDAEEIAEGGEEEKCEEVGHVGYSPREWSLLKSLRMR